MSRAEPLEPEVADALQAIDATLHGEPVDPAHAELAELSLILRDQAPVPSDAFLNRLDFRARMKFADPGASGSGGRPGRGRWFIGAWGGATAVVVAALIAFVVVFIPHDGSVTTSSSGGGGISAGSSSNAGSAMRGERKEPIATSTAPEQAASGSAGSTSSGGVAAPPHTPGRQLIQSAQLQLAARAGRIERVAGEVFDVVGAVHGSVASSRVTAAAGAPGEASFTLEIPSRRLATALTRLSRLTDARVVSRQDASRDVTGPIDASALRVADDRALVRSDERRLAAATTATAQARAQTALRGAQAALARDARWLGTLHHRVSDATVEVSVTAPALTHHPHRSGAGGGFTIHRALHDAGRVLIVAAGVLLIAVAVLLPVALLIALAAWIWSMILRRRRESALESAG